MLHFGLVTQVDAPGCRVRVVLIDMDNLSTDWLPVVQFGSRTNKGYWTPDEGEQVACFLEKDMSNGVVVGTLYNSEDKPSSDASGPGVRALQLVADGAAVFLAKIKRAAAGAFSIWSKSSMRAETDSGNIELAAGLRLLLLSAGPLGAKAGGEDGHKLLYDIGVFLRDHKHISAAPGQPTPALFPADLATIIAIQARIEKFIQNV